MNWVWDSLIVLTALVGMEVFAWATHKYIMHGWGWGWHRSHHEPRTGRFEKNDLYALVFSLFVVALFALGGLYSRTITMIAIGITLYGALYSLVHDGLVHQRFPFRWRPKRGYLKRLVQAHRLHHAVSSREGGVSFGFLWAPDPKALSRELKVQYRTRRLGIRAIAPPN